MLVDPALSGLPAFLTPKPGLNSGFMIAQVTAAALVVGEQAARLSRQRRFDPDFGQSGGPRLDGGPRRAPAAAMAENAAAVVGIELLAAAQGCDFHAPLSSSPPLEAVRALRARNACRISTTTAIFHPDIARGDRPRARPARFSRRARRPRLPTLLAATRAWRGHRCREEDQLHERQSAHRQRPHDPRAARRRDLRQKLADRSAAAHADEQSRPRSRREAARTRRLWRHRPRRARLGGLRQNRRDAQAAGSRSDAARPVRQAGRRVPHPRGRATRADRQFEPRAALGDAGTISTRSIARA